MEKDYIEISKNDLNGKLEIFASVNPANKYPSQGTYDYSTIEKHNDSIII